MNEYREVNVTSAKTLTKYEIETKDKDQFLLLHEGYIEARYYIWSDAAGTALTAQEDTCLQNNAISLFKNAELMCEDNRIEYCDSPAISHTIKNLTDFSKPHGDTVASNQHFFLDLCDGALSTNSASYVRFYNNSNILRRRGVEIVFVQNAAFKLVPNVAASDDIWRDGDPIVARLGHFNGQNVNFTRKATATNDSTAVISSASLTTAAGILTITGAVDTDVFQFMIGGNYKSIVSLFCCCCKYTCH